LTTPPLLFYPKDLRRKYNISNLLTVPVHAACTLAYQFDEEYFVHILLPMTRGGEAGDAHHARIFRKMQAGKNVPLVNMVMDEFKRVVRGVHLPATRVAWSLQQTEGSACAGSRRVGRSPRRPRTGGSAHALLANSGGDAF
jgi:hypothetical protein